LEISFDEIRSIQRKERNIASLSEVDPDFYRDLVKYIKKLLDGYDKGNKLENARVLENTIKVSRDIMEKRLQKIVLKALKAVKTGEYLAKGMTREERRLYDDLVEVLRNYKSVMDAILSGDYEPRREDKTEDETIEADGRETVINEEDKNIVLVRTRKAIPRFVAPDGNEYGPYGVNEIVKMPTEIADVLREQDLIELI